MAIGKNSHFSCAANFLRGRKCIFCGSFKVLRTARGYVKCRNCGKSKSFSRLRREIAILQGFYWPDWFFVPGSLTHFTA